MPSLEEAFEKAIQDGTLPGAVLMAQDKTGTFNYSKAFGKRTLANDSSAPMTLDTVFTLASMTKLMTSIAAMQLVEQGLINLEDDVSHIIPELANQFILTGFDSNTSPIYKARTKPLLFKYLLTHSSGAAYDFMSPKLAKYLAVTDQKIYKSSTVDTRFAYPLVYEPGESWLYSTGIDWAGKVIERLNNTTLEEYMRINIWEPLGITAITFWAETNPSLTPRLSGMTERDPSTGLLSPKRGPFINYNADDCFGGQGAYASLPDYIKILHSLLIDDQKLLKKETAAQMFQPQLTPASKAAQKKIMDIPELVAMFVGDFPMNVDYDWGIGGILCNSDNEDGRRKKGTLIWSGLPNLYWFIDREAGLCGVFGTYVLPAADPRVQKMIKKFEEGMYEKLAESKSSGARL